MSLFGNIRQLKVLTLRKLLKIPEHIITERSVECSFAFLNIGKPPATVLDIGCAWSDFPLALAANGFAVTGMDIRDYHIADPPFNFVKGSVIDNTFSEKFDVITAISTIEHIGLSGRYGVGEDSPAGDRDAIQKIKSLLNKEGRLILTVPFGEYAILSPWHRVYDSAHIEELLNGFNIIKENYFIRTLNVYESQGCWVQTKKEFASKVKPFVIYRSGEVLTHQYALACYVAQLKTDS